LTASSSIPAVSFEAYVFHCVATVVHTACYKAEQESRVNIMVTNRGPAPKMLEYREDPEAIKLSQDQSAKTRKRGYGDAAYWEHRYRALMSGLTHLH
jgi:hypothetical protein